MSARQLTMGMDDDGHVDVSEGGGMTGFAATVEDIGRFGLQEIDEVLDAISAVAGGTSPGFSRGYNCSSVDVTPGLVECTFLYWLPGSESERVTVDEFRDVLLQMRALKASVALNTGFLFQINSSRYTVACAGGVPDNYRWLTDRAKLVDRFGFGSDESAGSWLKRSATLRPAQARHQDFGEVFCFVAAGRIDEWPPRLVVEQRCSAADAGLLMVEETGVLFVGAGKRLLAYNVTAPRRLWVDTATWFSSWTRHDNVVLMNGGRELAAWSVDGEKLWSRSFEQGGWRCAVSGDALQITVKGAIIATLHLSSGVDIGRA